MFPQRHKYIAAAYVPSHTHHPHCVDNCLLMECKGHYILGFENKTHRDRVFADLERLNIGCFLFTPQHCPMNLFWDGVDRWNGVVTHIEFDEVNQAFWLKPGGK